MPQVVDRLESRMLLAATETTLGPIAHVTSKGTLVVSGSDAAEEITISQGRRNGPIQIVYKSSGQLTVTSQQEIPARSVKRILVEARGGSDKVTLKGDLAPATVLGGGGNDNIDAYSSRVTLNGGAGRDSIRHLVDPSIVQAGTYHATLNGSTVWIGAGQTVADVASAAQAGTLGPRGLVYTGVASGGDGTYFFREIGTAVGQSLTLTFSQASLIGGDGDDSLLTEYNFDQLDGGRGVDAAYFSGSGTATFINGQRPETVRFTVGTFTPSAANNVYALNTESYREID